MSDDDKFKAFFEQFGFVKTGTESASSIYTMVDNNDDKTGFPIAKFLDDDTNKGKLDLANTGMEVTGEPYYYGVDTLNEFYSLFEESFKATKFWTTVTASEDREKLQESLSEYTAAVENWREIVAVQMMHQLNGFSVPSTLASAKWNTPYEEWDTDDLKFRRIEKRFTGNNLNRSQFSSGDFASTFLFPEEDITPRRLFSEFFGFKNTKVQAAFAKFSSDGSVRRATNKDLNPEATGDTASEKIAEVRKTVPFLPGEINPARSQKLEPSTVEPYIPLMYRTGSTQHNGRDLEAKFIWGPAGVPENGDDEFITRIHDYPDWFMGNNITGLNLRNILLESYPDEHRGAIGWHREGPSPRVPNSITIPEKAYKLIYGDNYEFVVIGEKEFVPYHTVQGEEGDIIALFPPEEKLNADGDVKVKVDQDECSPRLLPPSMMPTFVMDGEEIDGGGILVVNGNLDVRTRFAYHGVLVVLGDLTVTPDGGNMKVDEDGNVVDAAGNVLNQEGNSWFYMDPEKGRQESEPAYEWLGSLIVQGKVVVGGEVYTAPADANDNKRPAGFIDIRGSKAAVDEVIDLWKKAAPNEGFVTERMGWSSGVTSTNALLWKD